MGTPGDDQPRAATSGVNGPASDAIIAALLTGATQREAAAEAGVSHRTVQRWLADPGFARRLQEAQAEVVKQVRRRIDDRTRHAADTLAKIADGTITADPVRVSAARALLQAFVQLQPKELTADVTTHDAPVIDYRFEGIDPEVLR